MGKPDRTTETRVSLRTISRLREEDAGDDSMFIDADDGAEAGPAPSAAPIPYDGRVRKSATTINICADLTLAQRRGLNILIYAALPRMADTTQHQLSLNALAWAMTGDARVTRNLRGIVADLKKMMTQVVEWDTLGEDGGSGEWEATVLVPWIRIRRDGMVLFRFTPEFQARLMQDLRSVEIALAAPLEFRSVYTLALYEHVRLYTEQGHTPWLTIEQLLALFGKRPGTSYSTFKRVNDRILSDAITVVNARSDVDIALETRRKEHGEVQDLRFRVTLKTNAETLVPTQEEIDAVSDPPEESPERRLERKRLEMRLADFGVGGARAKDILEKYDQERILTCLAAADAWIKRMQETNRPIRNRCAVGYAAVTEGWHLGAPSVKPLRARRSSASPADRGSPEAPKKIAVHQYLLALDDSARAQLRADFTQYLSDPARSIIRSAFLKHGWDSRAVLAELQGFLKARGIECE